MLYLGEPEWPSRQRRAASPLCGGDDSSTDEAGRDTHTMDTHTRMHAHMDTLDHTHARTHTHTYTHAHTHTRARTRALSTCCTVSDQPDLIKKASFSLHCACRTARSDLLCSACNRDSGVRCARPRRTAAPAHWQQQRCMTAEGTRDHLRRRAARTLPPPAPAALATARPPRRASAPQRRARGGELRHKSRIVHGYNRMLARPEARRRSCS